MIPSLTHAAVWVSLTSSDFFNAISRFGATCQPQGSFFGFPTWYKYLDGTGSGANCLPVINGINDLWAIVLAIIEILLRLAAIAAVVYVLYGGTKYITARGNPDKLSSARTSVQDALIGLIIAVVAIAVVNFFGRSFN